LSWEYRELESGVRGDRSRLLWAWLAGVEQPEVRARRGVVDADDVVSAFSGVS
jgi:hypothetical protein